MNQPDRNGLDRFLSLTLGLWAAATGAFVVVNGALLLAKGPGVFSTLVQVGPVSGLKLTYSAVGLVWLSSGLCSRSSATPPFGRASASSPPAPS